MATDNDRAAESRAHLFARLEDVVRGGFESRQDILDRVEEDVEDEFGELDADDLADLVAELEAHVRRLWDDQRAREASWREPTTNDAIDQAFAELNARGIVALQNAGYTMSDGWCEVNEIATERRTPPRGAVFYHGQDFERAVGGGGLLLAFGAYEDDDAKRDAASAAIAREACETLARHGVATKWNGSVTSRVSILPFEWRKRCRPHTAR
ncbi:hypothetical protein ABH930_002182 [Kitasatospora sp. GAS204A]|uniref:DUF6891 domain-containing protein n=1 Tax=unclassified Kitasatospora TaxID=2633591 RepID=UPI002473FFF0|nr:hypothetical protein [Kitasatospora sp. GAS204B]MDH6115955.1 hypothetical protein [Kitasatospora sp. GAS204B]